MKPSLFGFPIWTGKVKRRVAKKYLRRFRREHTLRSEYQRTFSGISVGSYVNDCSGMNGRIVSMTPCYHPVGRGAAVLVDVDFMTTNTGCSLASCGVEPALSREVIEKSILEHHKEWTLGDGGKTWYGTDTEKYAKAVEHAQRVISTLENGGHVVSELGELLPEFKRT